MTEMPRPRRLRLPRRAAQRMYDWLTGRPSGLVALALAVGAGTGVGAVIFRNLIQWFTLVFSGHADYSAANHAPHPLVPLLGMWFVLLAPAVGGSFMDPSSIDSRAKPVVTAFPK